VYTGIAFYGFDTKVSGVNIPIKEYKNLLSAVKQKAVVQELKIASA
jgi:hypothetical protein